MVQRHGLVVVFKCSGEVADIVVYIANAVRSASHTFAVTERVVQRQGAIVMLESRGIVAGEIARRCTSPVGTGR